MKPYEEKINTNVHDDNIPKEGCNCICLSEILVDSVFDMGDNYYHQVCLEEYKCAVKEKKMTGYITDDLQISSDDSDEENSDEEILKN